MGKSSQVVNRGASENERSLSTSREVAAFNRLARQRGEVAWTQNERERCDTNLAKALVPALRASTFFPMMCHALTGMAIEFRPSGPH